VPFELQSMYRAWLIETVGISDRSLETGRVKPRVAKSKRDRTT
jgi:hypothetical protein